MLLYSALLVGLSALQSPPLGGVPGSGVHRSTPIHPQEPTALELRAALDALRTGSPGVPAFDAALGQLPALLESHSAWWVAGAAYVAGREGRTECVPALLEALAHEYARTADSADTARRALLDALLRLDARVPVQLTGRRFEPGSLAEAFLLLVREPQSKERTAALLALFDAAPQGSRARWATACALVVEGADGVAARLITASDWTLRVCVSDEGEACIRSGGTGGGSGSSHAEWPPRVSYRLELPSEHEPLLPIRHVRSEHARSSSSAPELEDDERGALHARLLAHLSHLPASGPWLPMPWILRIAWTDANAYQSGLLEHFELLRTRLGLWIEELGLPPELLDEVVIRVSVHDLRSTAAESLPAGPRAPGVVYDDG